MRLQSMLGTSRRRWSLAIGVLLILVIVASGALYNFAGILWLGGPRFSISDNDPFLNSEARTGLPVIRVLNQFHNQHGAYPSDGTGAGLHPTLTIAGVGQVVDGWMYCTLPKGDGFEMSRRLTHDSTLVYHCNGTTGTWAFNPGDGSSEVPLALNP